MSADRIDLDAIEARASAATPGPWERRVAPREGFGIDEKSEYMRRTAADNGEPLQVLIAESHDPDLAYIVPALTGDGPTSEANAEFIAHARGDVPALIAEVRTLRAALNFKQGIIDDLAATVERLEADGEVTA